MEGPFRLQDYLRRIGFAGPLKADHTCLAALQAAHVNAIPFEALDPFLGRPVPLDIESLQSKLLDSRRGGYCFEHNALFQAALEAIGFSVTGLGARVRWMAAPDSPLGPKVHMLLKVDLPQGAYLADVGFGSCLMDSPVPLVPEVEHRGTMGTFRITEQDGLYWLCAKQAAGWRTAYVFDLAPQLPADYLLGSWYTATSPQVPFTRMAIVERLQKDRRYKLINTRFVIETRDGRPHAERLLANAQELGQVLDQIFGITPPVSAEQLFEKINAA